MTLTRVFFFAAAFASAALAIGCNDPLLPAASVANVVDTVTMYALRGTDVSLPSGFRITTGTVTRTDQPGFDLAFDINDAGTPLMYPAGALGLPRGPGLLKMTQAFDSIISAPLDKTFEDIAAVAIPVGTVFVGRSARIGDCGLNGALPRYGKFRVLSVNPTVRAVTLETLVNVNCGYRDLRPGIPSA